MAADAHRYPLWHASPNHVANRGPPEVVEDAAGIPSFGPTFVAVMTTRSFGTGGAYESSQAGRNAGRRPRFTEIAYGGTPIMEDESRYRGALGCFHQADCSASCDQVEQFAAQNQRAAFAVL